MWGVLFSVLWCMQAQTRNVQVWNKSEVFEDPLSIHFGAPAKIYWKLTFKSLSLVPFGANLKQICVISDSPVVCTRSCWCGAPKCTKSDLKKIQICPIWGQSDPIWMPILTSFLEYWGRVIEARHVSLRSGHRCLICVRSESYWPQNGTNPGLFQIRF